MRWQELNVQSIWLGKQTSCYNKLYIIINYTTNGILVISNFYYSDYFLVISDFGCLTFKNCALVIFMKTALSITNSRAKILMNGNFWYSLSRKHDDKIFKKEFGKPEILLCSLSDFVKIIKPIPYCMICWILSQCLV